MATHLLSFAPLPLTSVSSLRILRLFSSFVVFFTMIGSLVCDDSVVVPVFLLTLSLFGFPSSGSHSYGVSFSRKNTEGT